MRETKGERRRKRESVREWRDGGKEGCSLRGRYGRIFTALDELI